MPPEYLAPGVYVEELSARARPIEGVGTSTAAFTGVYLVGTLMRRRAIAGAGMSFAEAHRALHEWERMTTAPHAPSWTDPNAADVGVTLLQLFAFLSESLLDWGGARPASVVEAAARFADVSLTLVSGRRSAAFGVVAGLKVAAGEDGKLTITPGMALDASGRAIDPASGEAEARPDTAVRRKRDP